MNSPVGTPSPRDSGNRRLRDTVVKPERLVIALGSVSGLHATGQLDDAACRVDEERALRTARVLEPFIRFRVNDQDCMDGRLPRPAQLPFDRVALFGIAKNSRTVRVGDPLLELERKRVENLPWQPDGGEPVGAERDVQRHRRLDRLAVGRDGPRAGGCDRRPETPQPEPRPSRRRETAGRGRQRGNRCP